MNLKFLQILKNSLTAVLAICFSVSALANGVQKITIRQSKSPFTVKMTDEKSTVMTMVFELNQLQAMDVKTEDGKAQIFRVDNAGSFLVAGVPDLPILTGSVVIPDHGSSEIEVVPGNYREINDIDVAPSKGSLTRDINPDDVPYVKGEVYGKDAFFPGIQAQTREPFIIRDFRGQSVEVYPVQYNPVSRTLRIYETITVHIRFNNKPGVNEFNSAKKSKIDPEFAKIYNDLFINYKSEKYTPLQEEGELLIICYDDFMSAMQPFVNWKNSMGRKTTMVPKSQVGATSAAIKNYISTQYNTPGRNLTYVLLVGDAPQIPASSTSNGASDNHYGYLVGNDSYNEVFIGRFSAENVSHVNTMVDRIIYYERDIDATATWLNTGLGVSKNEGAGNGHFGEADYQHIDFIRDTLLNYTYATVHREYEGVSGLPNTSATAISQRINQGTGIINYCNHGSVTGWSVANYNNSHVTALTNVNKLPFIWSVACVNGDFVSNFCFAEAWMRATYNGQPTGAISVLMSTINQPWQPPMTGQDHMVGLLAEGFANNIKRTFGGLSINGNFKMIEVHGSEGIKTHDTWTIFGDPTLMVRTDIPQTMIVAHNPTLFLGSSSFTVSCDTDGALVAISREENGQVILLGKAVVSSGQAIVAFNEPITTPSDLKVVVTGYNRVTYQSTISAVPANEPYVVLDSYTLTSQPNYGSSFDLNISLKNISQAPYVANNVTAQLSTQSSYATIINGSVGGGTILPDQTVSITNAFTVNVANDVPDQTPMVFTIIISGSYEGQNYQWTQNFTIKANAPVLSIGSIVINDAGAGIPGVLDPGETATAQLAISNTGHASVQNVAAGFVSNSAYLSVTNSTFQIASLAAGEQSLALFEVSALANTPLETVAPVSLSAQSGSYQASKNSQIIIGYIPEYNMNSETVTACIGRFYDSGGPNGAYANNENFTKTFFPATSGAKLMFNFSAFDVESGYDKLYVYDGPTATSPQIQGSPFTGTTSPGTFMATNAEGAITFKFTSDGMVTKPGWTASFYCVDLSVPPASATNPTPANGAVVTVSPVNFSWSFVPGATSYDIYFGLGTLPSTPTANVTTNSWTNTVSPYSNYVWKVVPKNAAGEASDCETWNFSTQAISTTILMQNGQISTCNAVFYDSGGENGQYGNNENFVLTLYPSNNYSKVKLVFQSFNVENNYDKLYLYDGPTVTAPQVQGSPFTGTNSPGTKVATNPQGALTIKFTSDVSVVGDGWKAIVSCEEIAGSQALITDFGFEEDVVLNTVISPVINNNATITVWVNSSADLSSLTPIMTLSDGASVNPPMGSPTDFTNPVTFTVTSQNGLVVNNYQVTVISLYQVTFYVTFDGVAVEGSVIAINGEQITTDANGLASIQLMTGTYNYTVSKNGFNTISGEIVVSSDVQINISLTGIGDTVVENAWVVYPNPFKQELIFDRISNVAKIQIFDATGRNVQTIANSGSSLIRISTESLSSGVYLIGFTLNDGSQLVTKLIKQ